ncbi:MAG: NERD domain-containing protein [Armatimonadetes bacterium]|nr:NERD domain-containing protein [Armatimonadota bacterium]
MKLYKRPSKTRPVAVFSITMAVFMALGLLFFALYYPQTELYGSNRMLGGFIYVLGLTVVGNSALMFLRIGSALMTGWRNENRLLLTLRELPDSFTGFTNLLLPGPARLDVVLVGPKGVIVLVVKHYTGRIIYDGKDWTRIRPNRKHQRLRDLSAQVRAAEKAVSQAIKERNVSVPVIGRLVFANPKGTLEAVKLPSPVLRPETLLESITALPDKLSEESSARIGEAMKGL